MFFIQLLILLSLFVFLYQLYKYAVTRTGVRKEKACYALGISYFSVGVVCLVFRSLFLAFAGLFLIMLGLLLIAHGLERKNKTIFIDRYAEDQKLPDKKK